MIIIRLKILAKAILATLAIFGFIIAVGLVEKYTGVSMMPIVIFCTFTFMFYKTFQLREQRKKTL